VVCLRSADRAARVGALAVAFQVLLIASGNLSFLNYLTIVPALACLDDRFLARVLPRALVARAARAAESAVPSPAQNRAALGLAVVVGLLSIAPVGNLLSSGQIMNTSFDRMHLVNTYGAFGSVGRERYEIVFEGTTDETVTEQTRWREYEFPCKPGSLDRRPCIVSPYQPRLDWQIWFAAMSSPENYPWTLHLVWKLLHNDPGVLGLLAGNPFPEGPPRHIRAELFLYRFSPRGDPSGAWWRRERRDLWLPPLAADDPRFLEILESYGWRPPRP
jgi:hypothetical protein